MLLLRRLLTLVAALLVLAAAPAFAASPARSALVLDDAGHTLDAWDAEQVLFDPDGTLGIDDVRRRAGAFATPAVPENNFGPRKGAVWLRVPVVQSGPVTRWVLEVDYPPLNRIDAWVVRNGVVQRHVQMGNTISAEQRPMRTRAHTVMLDFAHDAAHEVYLRVESTSAMVIPVRFHAADAFVTGESARLLLQGLMFGVTLMLLVTSVVNGFSLRDMVFVHYALMILGVAMFFVSFAGLGHQFLWPAQTGALAKVSPWGALLAMSAACLFVSGALDLRTGSPKVARVLRGVAIAGTAAIALSVLGALDYRQTQVAATVLGPIPIVLALYESWIRARRGSRMAIYMAIGWAAYTAGSLAMAAVLRGWVAADFWMQHLFQFASVLEMFAWMRVLALRIEDVRRGAERAAAEKNALHSLAHTDPLTGLPNRRGLAVALEAALPAARADRALAVYLLDLDGFKSVNDRLGHDAGDALLTQVARRLQSVLRATDVVARQGGDEFVVMVHNIAGEAAAVAIGQKMLEAFRTPFDVNGQACSVGLTIGFAIAPQDGASAGDLLRRADAAMYAGKQGGRNCVRRGGASAGLAAAM